MVRLDLLVLGSETYKQILSIGELSRYFVNEYCDSKDFKLS